MDTRRISYSDLKLRNSALTIFDALLKEDELQALSVVLDKVVCKNCLRLERKDDEIMVRISKFHEKQTLISLVERVIEIVKKESG